MTSITRDFRPTPFTLFNSYVSGPAMYGNKLFPFSYRNGTLDLILEGTDFQETMMTTPRWPGETGPNIYPVRDLGGNNNVQNIGQNLKNYITAIYESRYDATVWDIRLVQKGAVRRVVPLDATNVPGPAEQYGDSTVAPNRDYRNDDLGATYVFVRPMTIQLKVNNQTRYFTLKSDSSDGTSSC
jgi:hypothetical protein